MGRVVLCYGSLGPDKGEVQAMLEGHAILLKGDFKAKLAVAELQDLRTQEDLLVAHTRQGPLALALGEKEAALWLKKILHPPSLADKLGVSEGLAVHLQQAHAELKRVLDPVAPNYVPLAQAQLAFIVVDTAQDLTALKALAKAKPEGCQLWVLRRKGAAAEVKESEIMALTRAAGLAPSKTSAWSDTYAADRYGRARS
ncbi:hypothetical protein LRH25_19990 [Ideonella azotifigens]|uniref:Uncharacterized protein n=1 Tax=Ideonella azotifigens TaxID=513160 RepID=A0ABN1K0B9_9BURK|nr:hypothetical protein [Ideonella azotifigens]MCD2342612.1 hypothetical protein [Ideonella azotifigens]